MNTIQRHTNQAGLNCACRKCIRAAKKKLATQSYMGRPFQLIGRKETFVVIHESLVAGFIPAVIGRSHRYQTSARIADVVFLDDPQQMAWLASITTEAK